MIIAVDGPAASGKGTIARALAAHFGLPHMDTGLLYRATAKNLLEMGGDPESEFAAARLGGDNGQPGRHDRDEGTHHPHESDARISGPPTKALL